MIFITCMLPIRHNIIFLFSHWYKHFPVHPGYLQHTHAQPNYYWTEGNSFSLGSVLSVVPKMVCVSGNFFSGFVCCLEEFMHFMLLWHSLQLNPLSCWHCLYLAILFVCHHLVWSSACSAREIRKAWSAWSAWSGIVLPHDSGAISEAVCICACNPELLIACHRAVSPLLSHLVVCWFGLHAPILLHSFSWWFNLANGDLNAAIGAKRFVSTS